MNKQYSAICDNFGYWHVIEQDNSNNEIKKLLTLTKRELAVAVRDDLVLQYEQQKQDEEYEQIRAKRDNMSPLGDSDYEV
jgi:hypothetical protein